MGETNEPIRTKEVKYWRRDRGFPLLRILHPFKKDTTKRPKIFFGSHKIFYQSKKFAKRKRVLFEIQPKIQFAWVLT